MATKERITYASDGTPVRTYGDGPTVILIHGVMMDHRMWQHQITALSPHFRLCYMDMLGHGDAPDPPGERTLRDFVTQLDCVVSCLSSGARPALIGYSMGGLIAQAYAIEHHDQLSALVLMSTVHDRAPQEAARVQARYQANLEHGVENAVQSATRRWFRDHERARHGDEIRATRALMRDGNFSSKCKAHRVFVTADADVTGRLGAISCPTLVMTGADDAGSTPAMARKMAGAIAGSELHILDGQHHMLPLLDRARVNGIINAFLKKHAISGNS